MAPTPQVQRRVLFVPVVHAAEGAALARRLLGREGGEHWSEPPGSAKDVCENAARQQISRIRAMS